MFYNGQNPAILRLRMELMMWAFKITHRNAKWVMDADWASRTGQTFHFDPLLEKYDILSQILYQKHKPPEGEITQETLPGFRRSKATSQLSLPNVSSSDLTNNYIRNIPVKFMQTRSMARAVKETSNLYNDDLPDAIHSLQNFTFCMYGVSNSHIQVIILTVHTLLIIS